MHVPKALIIQRILPHYRLRFFQALSENPNIEYTVACGDSHPRSAISSHVGVEGVRFLPVRNCYIGGDRLIVWQTGLLNMLAAKAYDAVIAEFNPKIITNLLAFQMAQAQGVSFLWWGHGIGPGASRPVIRLRLWLLCRAQAAILYDEKMRERLVGYGAPKEKLFVAPNSIDTAQIEKLRALPLSVSEERFRILFVGRLIPLKKVDLLLRGFALIVRQLSARIQITIVGDGPERTRLVLLAEELGIASRVEFTGAVYVEELLADYFNTSLVSVYPGTIGLSAIHSLAYGVPVLVARDEVHGPEVNALQDGINASFFLSDSPQVVGNSLLCYLQDAVKQRRMQAQALSASRRYSLDAMVQTFNKAVNYARQK